MSGSKRYRIAAVEPDQRFRTRLMIEMAATEAHMSETIDAFVASLEGDRPTVVVFGPSLANDTGIAQAQRIARTHPEVGVVLLTQELSLALLQQALRAGVRDVLTLDTDETGLSQAIERVGNSLAAPGRARAGAPVELGRVIVTFSTKGGVGKSITATNLAVALATRSPKQVAIIDGDLQFGDVAVLLGVPPTHTTIDAAAAIDQADSALMDSFLATHPSTGLRVLPAPVEPSAADSVSPEQMLGIVRMLRTMCDVRDRRHAAALRRRRARAARGGRRRPARREHGHPEHQEPEGRHPDARPAVDRRFEAAAGPQPGQREGQPRHRRCRAGDRPARPSSAFRRTSPCRKR